MRLIIIENNILQSICNLDRNHQFQNWKINLDDILIIGGINRMDGDNDSDFLVFITKSNKYFLNITWEIASYKKFVKEIDQIFNISLTTWPDKTIDSEIILYPKSLTKLISKIFETQVSNIN